MLSNRRFSIPSSTFFDNRSLLSAVKEAVGENAIRWYISDVTANHVNVEATLYSEYTEAPSGQSQSKQTVYPGKCAVLNIIPTGIGCSIGGYAGDATPANNVLAAVSDYLITNPNTVNASNFINLRDNVLYAEGHAIDLFCQGVVDFHIPYANKVGVIIEKTEADNLDVVFNVINTVRAIHGVNIVECVVTDDYVNTQCQRNEDGVFVGTVGNPEVLFKACKQLKDKGANAIAITTNVQNLPPELYRQHFSGEAPNPVGGSEAIISHLIMQRFSLPVAHAPLINFKDTAITPVVDARGAGEMASKSGLACVLVGLHKSPQIQSAVAKPVADIVNLHNLLAVVMPSSSLGGLPVLHAQANDIPVIAVQGNETVLDVTHKHLPLNNIIVVKNYAEAAGVVAALKHGINLESISRPFKTLTWRR